MEGGEGEGDGEDDDRPSDEVRSIVGAQKCGKGFRFMVRWRRGVGGARYEDSYLSRTDLLKSSGMTTALFQRMIRSYTRRGDLSASSYGVPSEGDAESSSESESDVSEDEVNEDAAREVERIESENILGAAFNK